VTLPDVMALIPGLAVDAERDLCGNVDGPPASTQPPLRSASRRSEHSINFRPRMVVRQRDYAFYPEDRSRLPDPHSYGLDVDDGLGSDGVSSRAGLCCACRVRILK
jgi:hypothetical protein